MTLANAGHVSPYVGNKEIQVDTGLPLGLDPNSVYGESTIRLTSHQQITLITDGVVEARSKTGELFGFDRTSAITSQSADGIAHAAQAFGQDDDITVLTLQFSPEEIS